MAKKIDITKRGLTPAQSLAPDETINPDSIESGTVVDTSKKNPSATLTNGSGTSRLDSVIADKLSTKALETAGKAVALSEELNLSLQQMQELEASIREQLAKEKTERQLKDEDLQQQITEERRRATETEGSLYELSGDITDNGTNPASSLVDAINKEVKRRQEEDKALDKRIADSAVQIKDLIDAEATEREKADAAIVKQTEEWFVEQHNEIESLSDSLAAETTRATEAETRLSTSLEEEKQRAITKENALSGEIAKNSDRIDNLTTTVEDTSTSLSSEMEALRTAHKEDIDNLNTALSAETERSKAADTELSGKIDDEATRAKAAEKQVNDDLIAEMQIRAQQDATLQNSVNTLNSDLNSLGAELRAKLGAEEDARKQADILHDNELEEHELHLGSLDERLEQEIQDRKDADGDLDTLATENRDNLVSAINELHSDLENEVNRATTTEGNLEALETEDNTDLVSAINSEVNRAKTTEGELENLTTEANENLVSAINEVQKELEDEISNRTSTTDDLDKRLKQEATDREAADNTLTENLNKEIEDRKHAVTAEQEAREAEDKSIREALTAETTRATGVEDKLREGLTTETSNRTAADATLQTNIDSEADTREKADTQLQSNITAEETTRKDEITRVEGLISAEETRATAAEEGLDTKISNETTRAIGREGELDAAITAEQTRAESSEQILTNNLNSETERATGEEGRIEGKLDNEIERAKKVEGDLESLTPPATNLVEALNKEYTRATEAESDLDSRLTQEIKGREVADANLQNSLTTDFEKKLQEEKDRATTAEQANTAAIEAEVNRAMGVEGTLTDLKTSNTENLVNALNSEVDRATTAEEANAAAIEEEESRATGAEADLQSAIDDESKTRESKDTALGKRIDDLSRSLDTNTSDLEQKITDEQTRAEAAEKKNAAAITDEETRAKGIEGELSDLNSDINPATNLVDAVNKETARAKAAEQAESDRATLVEGVLDDLTTTEKGSLVEAINSEVSRAKSAEASNTRAIGDEKTRAENAEKGLDAKITTLTSESGASLELSTGTTTWKLTFTLKNKAGAVLGTSQTVDLPIETLVKSAKYVAESKTITFTCQNNTTFDVDISNIISGLATESLVTEKFNALTTTTDGLNTRLTSVEGKIPTAASATNQLADKDFVNSSIQSQAADYVTSDEEGNSWPSLDALKKGPWFYMGQSGYTPTKNDYAMYLAVGEDGETETWRALYDGKNWVPAYKINSALTSAQEKAVNSGITKEKLAALDAADTKNANDLSTHASNKELHVTQALQNSWNQAVTDIVDLKGKDTSLQEAIDNEVAAREAFETAADTKYAKVKHTHDWDDITGDKPTQYVLPTATETTLGGVKLGDATVQTVTKNAATATAGKTYPVQMNADSQLVVNIPWVNTTYSVATTSKAGLVMPKSVIAEPTQEALTTTAGKYYTVEMSSNGHMFVNVPWTDTVTKDTNTAHAHKAGVGLSLTGAGGISGDTTYALKTATASEIGGIKVGAVRTTTITTEKLGTKTTQCYAVELDSAGSAFVQVPWTDNNTTYNIATAAVAGLVKPVSVIEKPTINAATTTSGKYYHVQMSSDGNMFVNVPWTDNNTTYKIATATTAGLVKPIDVITKPTINAVSSTAGKYYSVEMSDDGNMFVNVPWTDNNTNTAHEHTAGDGLSVEGSGGISGTVKYSLKTATATTLGGLKVAAVRAAAITTTQDTTSTSQCYGIQLDSTGKGFVQVPWTNTTYNIATATVAGLVKPASVIAKPTINNASTTAGKYYHVQMSSDGAMFVNVPWTDNNTTYQIATTTTAGLVKPVSVITKPTINALSTTAGKYYNVEMSSDGAMFVNVPWTDNNTNTSHTHSVGVGLSITGSGGLSGDTKYTLKTATANEIGGLKVAKVRAAAVATVALDDGTEKCYGIELDNTGKGFVRVPWTDTNINTAHGHAAGEGLSVSGTAGTATGNVTYTLKKATNTTLGGVKLAAAARTTTVTATTSDGKVTDKLYGLEMDSDGKGFVRVPWTDTVKTLSITTSGSGNAVTSITNTDHTVTVKKDITFALASDLAKYLPLAGGTMTGQLCFKDGTACPADSAPAYLLSMKGFADGGGIGYAGVKNNESIGVLGWSSATTDRRIFPTINTIAYWNGKYNSDSSNLVYCKEGTILSKDKGSLTAPDEVSGIKKFSAFRLGDALFEYNADAKAVQISFV